MGGFDGQAYSMSMDPSEIIQPWNVAVQNILNINSVCVNYVDPSARVATSGPLTNNITAPDIGHNWFNGTKANATIAEQVAKKVNQLANNVNGKIFNGENVPTTIGEANPPPRKNSAIITSSMSSIVLGIFVIAMTLVVNVF